MKRRINCLGINGADFISSSKIHWRLGIAVMLGVCGAIASSVNCTLAQITPDATLGNERSQVTPNVNVRGFPAELIQGGATRGTNLFHSFSEFNIGNAQRVYFANPTGIENILSRVTGSNLSNILGTLGVDGGANLFFLNPNGIIFGQNAKLDIAGSFVASTANSVVFNNGYLFSAKNPEVPPLLTVNVPLGVQYGTNQLNATITNSGNLAVGQNFTLSAGNLDLQGQLQAGRDLTLQAQDTVKVRDSSTSPFIASADGNLLVQGNQGVDIFALNHPDSGLFAETWGTGDGGNVEITTPSLLLTNGARANVSTYGEGKAGSLIVNASQAVRLVGTSADSQFPDYLSALTLGSGLFALTTAKGDGGNVEITTPLLLVQDGAQVSVSNFGEGKAGNLIVNASEAVQLIGTSVDNEYPGGLLAFTTGKGDGGNVEITTPLLFVQDGAQVSVSTFGEGKGGNLIVNASQSVQLMGTTVVGQFTGGLLALSIGKGDGGNVQITTPLLLVANGADVSVGTYNVLAYGEGKGGNLIVNASQVVQLMGTSADGQFVSGLAAATFGAGDGGNVEITTSQLLVSDGAVVIASTFDQGNGGDLIVNASEQVKLNGAGGLFVNAIAGGTAGDLTVKTNEMSVTDGAEVSVSSPQGQAGNLSITANSLTLNRGTISAETAKSDAAEGGANITLSGLDFLRMDNESLISASALGNANGGNVTIDSTLIVATPPTGPEGSDIIANADHGNGGRVNVTTQGLFGIEFRPQRTPKNDITVSSTFGLSGEYVLNTPGVDPSRGLAPLPTNVVDASQQIDQRCTPNSSTRGSSFTYTGRGGLPPSPNDPLQNDSVITNWVTLDSDTKNNTPPAPPTPRSSQPRQLVEAQGWYFNEKGQVVLAADAPNVTPRRNWSPPPECNPPQTPTAPQS